MTTRRWLYERAVRWTLTLPVVMLSGTTSSTPGSPAAVGRSRHRPRLAQGSGDLGSDGGGVVRLGSKSRLGDCHVCRIDCARVQTWAYNSAAHERQRRDGNGGRRRGCGVLQETGAKRQQIEQQSHAGPFAGPKPERMTVPCGASRSNRRAHPSRLGWARGFLPSWSCEFDSRHPL